MRVPTATLLVPLLASFALVACSSGDSGPAPGQSGGAANADNYCSAYCAADEKCDSTVDDTTCENVCHNTLAASGPHFRADSIADFDTCIATDDCADVKTSGGKCRDQASASIAPTSAAQSYCQQASDKATACGTTPKDTATCLDAIKIVDDASIQSLVNCLSEACDKYMACELSAVGFS